VSDKFPVIFSTNNTNSAIGYFDNVNDIYIPIIDDINETYKLGFSTDRYITGQAQRNHIGEVVVAFTDKAKVLYYLNCDNPDVNNLGDLSLFPVADAPRLSITQDGGGILAPGAYFVAARYVKKDGTITSFTSISGVSIVGGIVGSVATDRSLLISLSGLDLDYDFIELAIIFKSQGVFNTPQLMSPITITGDTMRAVYSGAEITTDISLESVLIPQASYTKAGTIGQLNDALYIGDLESEEPINMQPWANMIQVQFTSELMDINNPDPVHVSGEKRSFMHEEVVALYIQYSKTSGGWTQWFHAPGRPPSAGDLLASSVAADQGVTAMKFQVEDTVTNVDSNTGIGSMGIWRNENETYPNHPDFNSEDLGGMDLRGQQVLHHRFPSIAFCKAALYPTDDEYGKTKLDILGLRVLNVQIPAAYASRINGWRIGYAKRTLSNSLVQAQGMALHGAREAAWNGGNIMITAPDTRYVSTGGNFHSGYKHTYLGVDTKVLRFHAFDLLFNKPAVAGDGYYLSTQLKIRKTVGTPGLLEDYNLGSNDVYGPLVYLADYLEGGTPTAAIEAKRFRALTNTLPVTNNVSNGKWYNKDLETAYGANISNPILDAGDIPYHIFNEDDNEFDQTSAIPYEVSYLTNIMRLKTDVYSPFTAQKLIVASDKFTGVTGSFYGGDTYLVPYTFHTYGWWNKDNEKVNDEIGGTKVVRRFICESASNLYSRFETPGNMYSNWFPNSPLVKEDINNYITDFNTAIDPNQFGYSNDFNTLNELNVDTGIYNTLFPFNNLHPFRIARGGKLGRQDKTRSWRTWLPLDYYEIVKNFGKIINLDGQDDKLIIHTEKALMLTQDKTKLDSDLLSITLGAGDIFQFEPQDVQSSPLGYAGTTHDLACVRTPFGYVSVDAAAGELFLLSKGLTNQGKGLSNMLRDMLKVIPRNVLQGDGITIGYDPYYKRLLVTVKKKAKDVKIIYDPTDEQIANLEVGDHVYMHGRVLAYAGINDPNVTGQQCPGLPLIPVIASQTIDLEEGVYVNERIGIFDGLNISEMRMMSVVPTSSAIFSFDPLMQYLFLTGTLVASAVDQYTINLEAESSTGDIVQFTHTINVI
jgi:hypothetical protein